MTLPVIHFVPGKDKKLLFGIHQGKRFTCSSRL